MPYTNMFLSMRSVHLLIGLLISSGLGFAQETTVLTKPNVVVILADDIGYGDLGCYGATRIKTPNLDRLAREGLRFTDAYAPASVCTPTRYSLMTGEYAWRNPAGSHILSGVAPLSIRPGRVTLPGVLQRAGYATGIVGKWHLGLGETEAQQDWNGDIKPGPLEVGFTSSFIIPATGDRVPCVFIENHRVVGLDPKDPMAVSYSQRIGQEPTGADPQGTPFKLRPRGGHNDSMVNGIPRIGFMTGAQKARWVDEAIPETLARQAIGFLESNRTRPFFLYFAPHDVHAPRVANARWKGTSQCGIRGDVTQQLDWQVGELLSAIDRLGLATNTVVFFSSDNGGTQQNGYEDGGERDLNGHSVNGSLRGFKGSLWEGGTRVPLLVRWPGVIRPGTQTRHLAALVDLTATAAALTGQSLPAESAPDSFNLLPLLRSSGQKAVRDHVIVQNNGERNIAVRRGEWKFIPAASGPAAGKGKRGAGAGGQLFNLSTDLAETKDVAAQHPEVVEELTALLARARQGGTRPH